MLSNESISMYPLLPDILKSSRKFEKYVANIAMPVYPITSSSLFLVGVSVITICVSSARLSIISLVVDDDKNIVSMISDFLTIHNMTAVAAYTAKDALLHSKDPDIGLIVLDVNLEHASGFDV